MWSSVTVPRSHIVLLLFGLCGLSGCTVPPPPEEHIDNTDIDGLFDAWQARVPDQHAAVVAILPPESPDRLFGLSLNDSRDFSIYVVDQPMYGAAVLLDHAGELLLEQRHYENEIELIFPTADRVRYSQEHDGLRVTFSLAATEPPSILVLKQNATGGFELIELQAGSSDNTQHGNGPSETAKARQLSLERDCDSTANDIQSVAAKICSYLVEIPVEKVCESADEAFGRLKEALEDAGIDTRVINGVQSRLRLVCKGSALIKAGYKFFRGLSAAGWVCLTLDLAEDLAQTLEGKALADVICDLLEPCTPRNCPPGQVFSVSHCACVPECRDVICPPGQTLDSATCECRIDCDAVVCPPGEVLNPDTCDCVRDCFSVCPLGQVQNAETCECECPDGRPPDAFGNCCDLPPDVPLNPNEQCPCGDVYVGDITDVQDVSSSCIECAEAMVLLAEGARDYESKIEVLSQECVELLACEATCYSCCEELERQFAESGENVITSLLDYHTLLDRTYAAGCMDYGAFWDAKVISINLLESVPCER